MAGASAPGLVVELTEIRKLTGILTKKIALGEDGKPKSDGSGCRLIVGMARRNRMNGGDPAGALAGYLNGMDSRTALALGSMSDAVDQECRVVSRKRLANYADDGAPTITRTLDNFAFASGPGWALIDHDTKGTPAAVADKLAELGGPEGALRHLIPGFDQIARVARASTSSGLAHAETGEQFSGSGGRHDYLLLQDQRDAPRMLKALHRRAWRAGLGWCMVGTAGQVLERSIVDVSVGSPERLVFEGAPVVVAPLVQDHARRAATASPATAALDSREAIPDPTAAEEAEYQRLVAAERARLKPAAMAEQKKWIAREGAKLGPDGERIVKAALARRTLSGLWSLQFDDDDLGVVTVDAIMADPARYDGETLADPIDGIEYGRGKARLFLNDDGTIICNSFAHGGRSFRLLHSAASARAAIEKAGQDAARIYVQVILAAEINAGEEDRLIELVRDLTGIGKRPLTTDLKRAKAQAASERAEERAERNPVPDRRITRRAPLPDDERTPVVKHIEDVLRMEQPPIVFQNVVGRIVGVTQHRSGLLHVLTSDTAAGGVHADMFTPAPASPLITPYTPEGMREIVEHRIRYLQDNKEGGPPRAVTLPDGFIQALLAPRPSSTLPVLVAVSDVPVVTPNGRVIVAGGFHPESGIFFTCSEDEAQAILPADLTPAAVREAYLFLAQELFVDVALQDRTQGMAALVACLLTAMSHPVLPEKPVFRITAPQRGSGKTTVINMIVRPITRRSAAAASWSVNEEERRKALFAVAREGHGILMIDNIPRGTVIRDATIERFATSAEVRDRVLGESRTEAVRSPVVVLTGNALQMGGDSGSRTLTVELTADRPDPENRPFKHPDILGWCDRNRAQILQAALTILLGNPTLHTRAARIETRFKAWFVLVGSAVEHASALADMPARMVDLFAQSEGEDETVGVLVDLLGLLRQAFPCGEFTIEELTTRLLATNELDPLALNNQLLDAIHSAGRQPLRAITVRTVAPVMQRNVANVPISDADGKVWFIAPQPRTSGRDKIIWKITERTDRTMAGGVF
jgi:hypothetical protein